MPLTLSMILAVGAGGALGAVMRFITGSVLLTVLGARFPWGTLTVNVIGSLIMGIAAGLFARHMADTAPEWRAFLMVGVLGGFTTFSAFSLDVSVLMERGQMTAAGLYIASSVLVSIAALFAGLSLSRTL